MAKTTTYTPMIDQFLEIKSQYPQALLLYRMGDFYETFFEDARIASQVLEITLTSRGAGNNNRIDMAGIPHHALDAYLPKLIQHGLNVAICEQMEPPKAGKKLVKREVVRVITPGTLLEGGMLNEKHNNYLGAVFQARGGYGLAYTDISTGSFKVTQMMGPQAQDLLVREVVSIGLSEILLPFADRGFAPDIQETAWADFFPESIKVTWRSELSFEPQIATERVLKTFRIVSLEGFGCQDKPLAIGAAGAILHYLAETQMSALNQLHTISTYEIQDFMVMDKVTTRNLEITETWRDQTFKGSLLWVLDQTKTAMGGRLLRNWMAHPLLNPVMIEHRLDAIDELLQNPNLRFDLQDKLAEVRDIERLTTRVATQHVTARELKALVQSILLLPGLSYLLEETSSQLLNCLSSVPANILSSAQYVEQALVESPPISVTDGNLIADGISSELDEIRSILKGGKDWLGELETLERQETGIKSLKIGFSKNFGYYLEVSHANKNLVPEHYHRKQTLVNAERYITPTLKEKESLILNAEERSKELEYKLFQQLREQIAEHVSQLQHLAQAVARIDVLTSLTEVATRYDYRRPMIADDERLVIINGRHPVIERTLAQGRFVPNDTQLDTTHQSLMILTGPNMSGKSSYMRQVALIVLMAQLGSFVPAEQAHIGLCDRIFTRVGAVDDIATGQSTFMVEMTETANILNHSTRKSLILLDEIGRGTSTFDGVSIAWSVSEYIAQNIGARTIFATHYHELNKLENTIPKIRNYQVTVKEAGDQILFLHKVIPGGTDQSYGIEVARLAGLPPSLLARAQDVLSDIQKRSRIQSSLAKKAKSKNKIESSQLSLFGDS